MLPLAGFLRLTVPADSLRIIDLGRLTYAAALDIQRAIAEEVTASRTSSHPQLGRILLVEHDPVITVSRRPGAAANLLASPEGLAQLGVEVADTDRGGDITYHGPGQLVVYPILDLNRLNLGLHAYMRLLEQAVIDACSSWGLSATRDPGATGVWVPRGQVPAKIAAMGVRVRRWVSMHGLALNVCPDMDHFKLIVPCGLAGRPVTCLAHELADRGLAPVSFAEARDRLASVLARAVRDAAEAAECARATVSMNTP
jgi:lipoyl(octanoyl) transferase